MKSCKHVFIVFRIFLLITGMLCLKTEAFAADKAVVHKGEDYKVSVQWGIDGFAAYEYPVMAQVTVESKYDFTGTLRIMPEGYNGYKIAAYGEDIALAANQAKTFTFYMSNPGNEGKIKVELLNEKGTLLYSTSQDITLANMGTNIMVGVLSEDYNALNYFDGIAVSLNNYQGLTSTLELTKESFPADSGALSVLNYMIIDNFDTANLSDEQYAALKEWVNNGGILILALGSNYQNVLHCFSDDFVTGTIGSLGKKNLRWDFSEYGYWQEDSLGYEDLQQDIMDTDTESDADTESDIDSENEDPQEVGLDNIGLSLSGADALDFQLASGTELIGFSSDHTAYYRDIGLGRVVVLAYSLGMEPVVGYSEKNKVAEKLITISATSVTEDILNGAYYNLNENYTAMELARLADTNRKPSVLLYGCILLLYVVLVGPILYLVLKALKRREQIWVAIPVVVLVFTGVIFLTGLIYRINKPLVNTFSLITLDDDYKTERIYTSITCPKAKQYTVVIQPEYNNIRSASTGYSYNFFDMGTSNESFDYMIKRSGNGTELVLNNSSTFNENEFNVQKTEENDIGSIECNLQFNANGFVGTVTNQTGYDLTGVVVYFDSFFYQIDQLGKGEQVLIDPDKLILAANGSTFDNLYYNGPRLYSDIRLYTQYQIDSMMERNYVNETAYGQGCVWARISSYVPDFIGKSSVKQSGIGVIYQRFHLDYDGAGESLQRGEE